ncbi:hypothetical protein [Pasteurella multocida]|uniref:hypothetical protein n=1 Tax=Pasteurella multocida TaxID=747 RepID=UPI002D0CA023|nr:hypothetical protein [Pasteurella multocida]MEB3457360.1 hypothetical protein [Pasteurella multocida]
MNVLEIYRKNPDTVFITRSCCGVRVKEIKTYVAVVESLDGKMTYPINPTTGIFISPDKPDPLDIVDYERPVFTVGEYVTRDGRKAVVYYDLSEPFGMYYPLYGYIDGNEDYDTWTKQGHNDYDEDRPEDLTGPWVEKPYIITVNGKEFHPVKNPKDGERLFYVNLLSSYVANSAAWGKQRSTYTALSNLNLIYRTEEEAQALLEEISKPHTEIKHVD